MRQRREFTRNFKLSVLSELNMKKAAEVCREHNIHPVLLSKWKKDFNEDPVKLLVEVETYGKLKQRLRNTRD